MRFGIIGCARFADRRLQQGWLGGITIAGSELNQAEGGADRRDATASRLKSECSEDKL